MNSQHGINLEDNTHSIIKSVRSENYRMSLKDSGFKSSNLKNSYSHFKQSIMERIQKKKEAKNSFEFISLPKECQSTSDNQISTKILTELVDYDDDDQVLQEASKSNENLKKHINELDKKVKTDENEELANSKESPEIKAEDQTFDRTLILSLVSVIILLWMIWSQFDSYSLADI